VKTHDHAQDVAIPRGTSISKERPIQYYYEPWLLDLIRSDSRFLRKMGIKPCLLDDPCPEPPPEEFIRLCEMAHVRAAERCVRLTEKDAQWLKLCGVAWDQKPAVQLSLDFCGSQETIKET
jgi:hypothetical protein